MSPGRRREMVDRKDPKFSIVRQCTLLGVSRSCIYYRPKATSEEDLSLMREMYRQYLETPFYGSRRMKAWLERRGISVSRKRAQRLMRTMGLRAIYRKPGASRPDSWGQSLPGPALEGQDHPSQPGVGGRHHLPAHGPGSPLPAGGDGLAQPVRGGLADSPTPWTPAFAPKRWRRLWARASRRCSTPTREASSPAWSSPRSCRTAA